MPLYKSIEVNSQTNVKIWHIKESLDQLKLKTELKDENLNRLSSMKSDIRKKEFLSVRLLLKSFGFSDYDLTYDDFGKPILKNGCFISITHSVDYSAVAISKFPIGIDIEKKRDKILKIASKFIGFEANYLINKNHFYLRNLTIIWVIKEALYKLYSKPGISFKNQLLVIPFGEGNETIAWILDGKNRLSCDASFIEFENYIFAIVTTKQ